MDDNVDPNIIVMEEELRKGNYDIAFAAADKIIHKVEEEWHYPKMLAAGFIAETKTGVGFVRQFKYVHVITGLRVVCVTGVQADYWRYDEKGSFCGYWKELEEFLKDYPKGLVWDVNALC